jgi:hypothetical protein
VVVGCLVAILLPIEVGLVGLSSLPLTLFALGVGGLFG